MDAPLRVDVRPRHHRGDGGGIVLGWLVKVSLVMAVLGLCLFDGMSIGATRLTVQDDGAAAARAGSEALSASGDLQTSYAAAVQAARRENPLNELPPGSYAADRDGTVHLEIRREATTVVVHRIGVFASWATVGSSATARHGP